MKLLTDPIDNNRNYKRDIVVDLAKATIEYLFKQYVCFSRIHRASAIALTFDDGPHPIHTYKIMEILRQRGIKATFFVLGNQLKQHIEIGKFLVNEGHEIGNHTYAHEDLLTLSANRFEESIIHAQNEIDLLQPPQVDRLFRTPYGHFNFKLLWYLYKHNMKFIGWTKDSRDSYIRNSDNLSLYINSLKICNGDIFLFHEDYSHTVQALPKIIDDILNMGIRFETVGKMLRNGNAKKNVDG